MSEPIFTVIAGANGCGKSTRVLKGGHDEPVEDQLRRYSRSFRNKRLAIDRCDECVLFDNSTEAGHRIVGLKLMGREMLPLEPLPGWAEFLRS